MPTETLPALSRGPAETAHSGIREIAERALVTPDCVRLEVGEPDFPTPRHIVEAAISAASGGSIGYTATAGLATLREKIVEKLRRVNAIEATIDEINCAIGGTGAIAAAVATLIEPGDEVLVPDPGWPNYRLMLAWAQGRIVRYACRADADFLPDPAEIERLITPRTKLLIVNSPSNPTGSVFPRALVERLVSVAVKRNLYLLSDECYDQIILDGEHVSPAALCRDGRIISAFSFSKTYAMTGWRVGYVVANPRISDTITKVLESNSSCVPTVCQRAAEAALDGPLTCLDEMLKAYRERRDLAVRLLSESGILMSRPRGAFYIMADTSAAGRDARSFAFDLLARKNVAVAPGTAFGGTTPNAVRVSLASSARNLSVGIARMIESLQERPS